MTERSLETFLDGLRQSANVTASAARAGVGRRTMYRRKAEDEAFRDEWDKAVELGLNALEDECMRRAMEGVQRAVVSMGRVVEVDGKPLVEHAYSDSLAMFLLRAHRPERYRDRASVELNVQGDLAERIEEGRKRARASASAKAAQP